MLLEPELQQITTTVQANFQSTVKLKHNIIKRFAKF
jgi:hypothetical protein